MCDQVWKKERERQGERVCCQVWKERECVCVCVFSQLYKERVYVMKKKREKECVTRCGRRKERKSV